MAIWIWADCWTPVFLISRASSARCVSLTRTLTGVVFSFLSLVFGFALMEGLSYNSRDCVK